MQTDNILAFLNFIFENEFNEQDWPIFDSNYCSDLSTHPEFRLLKPKWHEKYKDLTKVVNSQMCVQNNIQIGDCLVIDSELKKV